ncbi:MAG: hypothetical protein EZS28_053603, partial [Streblomastix strix]
NAFFVTNGEDNALKVWMFDKISLQPRIVRYRDGHMLPPSFLRFISEDGSQTASEHTSQLISGSTDCTLRLFSTAHPQQSAELSQKGVLRSHGKMNRYMVEKKKGKSINWKPGDEDPDIEEGDLLRPPIDCAIASLRDPMWPGIATIHRNDTQPRLWHLYHQKISNVKPHILLQSSLRSVAISNSGAVEHGGGSGSLVAFGDSDGLVEVCSVQSGLRLWRFDSFSSVEEDAL